ncbi:MAG: UDP-glucose 4-epimerase GalE [Eubacteriales bacterium]|nr:UDP-glucose 4-epimerase GalE [Eubacteriales bacterium]MDD3200200.1 UDP-glucose 4-epimerase GalE [Eubacteriales bacterium]MDD4122088.1 UDP-glucose 4-epimerase GalE [Eubacteriales bacterium]MDD4630533.1 UDP-glucose 4-epimerase GalE [Eubacteriales bacterium]
MSILVTGGAGYIGSHTCVSLLKAGFDIVVLDNLCNSKGSAVKYIKEITGKDFTFYRYDLRDIESVQSVFEKETIEAVIHLAGYKAVGESVRKPLMYYENNILGTLNLLKCMRERNVKKLIFSSSATVYTGALGKAPFQALTEESPLAVTNPYGRTKLMIEEILSDLYQSDPEWNIISLRYFNPIGAHESGLLGDDPNGIPNNLMPYIVQVAAGKLEKLNVFGDDYDTKDGTGVRDYIHVTDLADGHVAALKKLKNFSGIFTVYNLGTGRGYSVLEIIKTFSKINGIEIPYVIAPRREGDVDMCFADPSKAERELGWKATRNLEDMCRDSWNFQKTVLQID